MQDIYGNSVLFINFSVNQKLFQNFKVHLEKKVTSIAAPNPFLLSSPIPSKSWAASFLSFFLIAYYHIISKIKRGVLAGFREILFLIFKICLLLWGLFGHLSRKERPQIVIPSLSLRPIKWQIRKQKPELPRLMQMTVNEKKIYILYTYILYTYVLLLLRKLVISAGPMRADGVPLNGPSIHLNKESAHSLCPLHSSQMGKPSALHREQSSYLSSLTGHVRPCHILDAANNLCICT